LKVLFISYDGMTDPLGQSQVIPYLKGLSALGHQISILSCEKKQRFIQEENEIRNLLEENNIKWFPIFYTPSPPILSTLKDIWSLKKKSKEIILNHGIHFVHCRSYITALVGQSLKRELNTPFIFDMRGFWADERVDGNIWNLKNPLFSLVYNYFKRKEKVFLKEADAVVSLTNNAKNEIHSWQGFQNVPVTVIPCCADLDFFSYRNVNQPEVSKLRNELGLNPGDFVLSYLGSLGTWYMLNEMLDFFKVLKTKRPEAKFLFITADEPEFVVNAAVVKGIDGNDIIVKKAKRNEVPVYCSLSSVSIFFILPKYSKKASSPTKMGELMSLGIPIICNSNVGDVVEILIDGGVGAVIDNFTNEDYLSAINKIPGLLEKSPQQNYVVAQKYYSLKEGVMKFNQVYENVSTRGDKGGDV
jgi:glycosyltransferase involved in cell wall biosynthesis